MHVYAHTVAHANHLPIALVVTLVVITTVSVAPLVSTLVIVTAVSAFPWVRNTHHK